MCYMPCPPHFSQFDPQTILSEEYRSLSSSHSFLHSPVTSSLSGPNVFLSTLFPDTLSLRSSLNVSIQVSHLYEIVGKIIVLIGLNLYIFGYQIGRQKILHQMIASIPWLQSAFNFFILILLGAVISLCIVTSSCILISRHDHVLSFIIIHF